MLFGIRERINADGAHHAATDPKRAAQFLPFAALDGFEDVASNAENGRRPMRIRAAPRCSTRRDEPLASRKRRLAKPTAVREPSRKTTRRILRQNLSDGGTMLDEREALISAIDDIDRAKRLAKGLSETAMAFAGTGMEGSEGWYMAGRSSMECYVELQRARECLDALKTWVYAEEPVSGKRG